VVLSADGRQRLFAERPGDPHAAEDLGRTVAEELLAAGAARLIEAARGPS
jgi:porphobilinogen deaminase